MQIAIHVCDDPTDAAKAAGKLEGRGFSPEQIRTVVVPSKEPPTFRRASIGEETVEVRNDTRPNREITLVIGLKEA